MFDAAKDAYYPARGRVKVKRQASPRLLFGAELRRLRLGAGLTQLDVSKALQYSTAQFVSNWERGVSMPPYAAIDPLARVFGVSRRKLVALVIEAETAILAERHRQLLAGA